MTDLNTTLEELGLSQYLQIFLDEGFDTWETLMDVTESDLDTLHVKLGHRRKLQRAIIEVRGRTKDNIVLGAPQQLGPKEEPDRSEEESGASARDRNKSVVANSSSSGGQKRKYRRHPKPDEYAPERSPSAYVIFSNQMRDRLKGQDLSFTEIAKIVGERWQVLSTNEKDPCERQAQAMKEKYYADLAEYKKTPQYSRYQEYLVEFKAKHNQKQENKRPKSEYEAHDLAQNTGQDRGSHALQSPSSSGNLYERTPWSVSPKSHEQQHADPLLDGKPPSEKSPSISSFQRFPSWPESEDGTLSGEPRRQPLPGHSVHGQSAQCQPARRRSIPYDPTSSNGGITNPSSHEVPCSPLHRNEDGIPSLARGETKCSASSEHSRGATHWSSQVHNLPLIDSSKGNMNRKLPVPSHIARLGVELIFNQPLDSSPETYRASHSKVHPLDGYDSHSKSSIATLLRAGEQLDRDAANHTIPEKTDRRSGDRY